MFKLKFAKMYDNKIFEKYNLKPVAEDYYVAKEDMFCVADGVTRDSIKGEAVPYPKNEEEARDWVKTYPNPSGAYESAKICANQFINYLEESDLQNISKETILEIIKKVNKDISKINQDRKIDYLANDYYGCVAVGGYISSNMLYCFSIGDSHIVALDENGDIQFETINNHKSFENYLKNVYSKQNQFDWNNAKDRIMVRRDYRNKPEMKYQGKDISFGALTGETEAEYYIDTYAIDLTNIKYICAYSDGCEPYFREKNIINKILKEPEIIEKEGKERTLIIYER